jgi:DNA-directed RNA polymerase specialized sigma24 family protein
MDIRYVTRDKSLHDNVVRVDVDRLNSVLRLMGSLHTSRIDPRPLWDGRSCISRKDGPQANYAEIVAVEPAGIREVVTLETSMGTYLANGLVAHNCLRRIRGAILDAMRANDWVTRSARTRAKALRDAGGDRGMDEAALAAATGLSSVQIRETAAAVAARPFSFDAEPHDVADSSEDVEGAAVVSSVLASVTAALGAMDQSAARLLVLRYYEGLSVADAAAALGVEPEVARELHEEAVLAVHDAMLRSVMLLPAIVQTA